MRRITPALLFSLAAAIVAAVPASKAHAQNPLVLSVEDTEAAPGETAILVVKTYQPRPISQGQLCIIIGEPTFTQLRRTVVRSTRRDATFTASLMTNEAALAMSSPTSSINEADGPMLLMAFTVDPSAVPGTEFELTVELPASFLTDELGNPIEIDVKPGTFTVKQPGAPHTLEADNEDAAAGSLAMLEVQTAEYQPLASGQVDYRYDTRIVESIESVEVFSLRNDAIFTADTSRAGQVLVTFSSPTRTIAKVPGEFIRINARIRRGLPDRMEGPIGIAARDTFLISNGGVRLPLVIDNGTIEIRND